MTKTRDAISYARLSGRKTTGEHSWPIRACATRDAALSHIFIIVRDSLVHGITDADDTHQGWLVLGEKWYGADGERRVRVRIPFVYETQKELRSEEQLQQPDNEYGLFAGISYEADDG